jgi:hypothetical protein
MRKGVPKKLHPSPFASTEGLKASSGEVSIRTSCSIDPNGEEEVNVYFCIFAADKKC